MNDTKVIALLQQKGGSGKTTTAMNISGGLIDLGYSVLVIDMDKDKPDAWSWAVKNKNSFYNVIQVEEKHIREKLVNVKNKVDFVIIDTPPNFQTAALKAALLAHLIIIPTSPSGMDLSGLFEAKELALTANRPYRLLANRIMYSSNMSRSLLKVIRQDGHSFSTYISQSVRFAEAESVGLYIGKYVPKSKIHLQVKHLAKEVETNFLTINGI